MNHPQMTSEHNTGAPFLTVAVLTRGNSELLQDTLLSLLGQEDMDFEVLLCPMQTERAAVQKLLDEQPELLRRRMGVPDLPSDTMGQLRNGAFAQARGTYIAYLDEGQLAFDHWVSAFRGAAAVHPGQVLHAYAPVQQWVTLPGGALRAETAPDTGDCRDFDWLRQSLRNGCPLCGLAFPGALLREWNLIFDETLAAYEDWDYLMRAAALVGVADIPQATALCRVFDGPDEYPEAFEAVCGKLSRLTFPVTTEACRGFAAELAPEKAALPPVGTSKLYWDCGDGFSEGNTVTAEYVYRDGSFKVLFPLGDVLPGALQRIRFDLTEEGGYALGMLQCVLHTAHGTAPGLARGESNGLVLDDWCLFPEGDPWVIWPVGGKPAAEVEIFGRAERLDNPDLLLSIARARAAKPADSKAGRIVRKVKQLLKG